MIYRLCSSASPSLFYFFVVFNIAVLIVLQDLSFAQSNPDVVTISENEIIRRQALAMDAGSLLKQSHQALEDGNLKLAYTLSFEAINRAPIGVATDSVRRSTIKEFSETAISYANWLIDHGQFEEAALVAKSILAPTINPNHKPAARILANLEQPDYYIKTIDPAFAAQRDDVENLLNQAEGYSATGRYDLATKRYEQVLGLDPYNIAARKGLESVNKGRTDYYQEAYNETRGRMLWQVEESWERPKPKHSTTNQFASSSYRSVSSPNSDIANKLNSIIIDKIDFSEISVSDFIDFLKLKSQQFDPERNGINIILALAKKMASEIIDPDSTDSQITPSTKISFFPPISNVRLIDAIRIFTELSNLQYKVTPYVVEIHNRSDSTQELVEKEYRIPPGLIPYVDKKDGNSSDTPEGLKSKLQTRMPAKEFFEMQGIEFGPGSFAEYIPSGSRLIVRNTPASIATIDVIVETESGGPNVPLVEIEAKFIEVNQSNLNELGFDWMLGPFSIAGGLYGAGGTPGNNQDSSDPSRFPFATEGTNPITAGNRSGIGNNVNAAIFNNSVDALISQSNVGFDSAAPGIFGIAGVFTNPQFQMVIRALSQKRGFDIMSSPKVTCSSGQTAEITIGRDFRHPVEWDEPVLPDPPSGNSSNDSGGAGIYLTSGISTPSTPSKFTNRRLGVYLSVQPNVLEDNFSIELNNLEPTVTIFDGFINYGSPIYGPSFDPLSRLRGNLSGISEFLITENEINYPIFSVREILTNVTLWDGQTVALGGLIREDVQKVQDKVPLLGDIPLAGRLFRSNVEQKMKKNLIIFVTARLIDGTGQPFDQKNVEEEFVELLGLPGDLPEPTFQSRKIGK